MPPVEGRSRAGFVFDLSGNRKLRGIRAAARYLNFNRRSQRIVAGGSLGFYQVVGAVGKAAEGGFALSVGCHDSGSILVCNPFDLLIGIPLVVHERGSSISGYFLVQDKLLR